MVKVITISDAFPVWLTATKTQPLHHHVSLIERPELIRRLNAGIDEKLSLLVASAGFGKSTLLAHWRKSLLEKQFLVAWLNIDTDDNDPSLFALYLAYSLAVAGLAEDIFELHSVGFSPDISTRMIMGVLLAAIAKKKTKIVLMLDGIEYLDDTLVKEVLEPLLRYSPNNLHVALTTRTAEQLQLSNLKLQGQVNLITTPDLKFTHMEIASFFSERLDRKTLLKVSNKTGGWPVALQLIKNSLSGSSDYKKTVDKFQGTEQDTRDYIFEQIVSKLPESYKNLLMDVSVLEQFDPDIADHIRDVNNSRSSLKKLEVLSGLISPLENMKNTYRLHPLFRQALLYHLEQSNPVRMKNLHLKATDLYVGQGNVIQSMRHALQAGEPDIAAKVLEKAGGILLWYKEGMTRIRKAHALLPEETIKNRPRLSLLRALIFLKDGSLNEARHLYKQVMQNLENDPHLQSPKLDYDLAVITSTLAVYDGTPLTEEMSDTLIAAIKKFNQTDKLQIGFVYTILCVFHLQKGDFPAAIKICNKAITHFQEYHSTFGQTYIYVHLGVIAIAEGNMALAYENYKKAQDNLRRYFIDDKDLKLVLNVLMAEWHYEKNELNTAARILGDANHRLETGEAWYEIYAAGYTTATALMYLQKGLKACLSSSEDAIPYIKREGLKGLNRLIIANKVGYLCRSGKIVKARKIVQENNLTFEEYSRDNGVFFSVRECYGVVQALARLLIAEKRYEEAIKELHKQIKGHQPAYEARAIEKYRFLLAIALYEKGEHTAGFHELEKTLKFVRTRGFLRFILDEEPFATALMKAYIQDDASLEKDHAQYILNQLLEANPPETHIILSRREKQVLNQLVDGYSDKVIARNLDITENTVRFHLKNLFAKLNVSSRLMAVSEANKHELL